MRFIESSSVPNGKKGIVIINKWQTILGQTIYTKTFQPKNISIQSHQSKETVSTPQLTIGKVLKIIEDLIDGKETSKNLSKKYKVDQLFVEQIGKYVTGLKDSNRI